jgi:hypothetical protein
MFIAGLVPRKIATASGKTKSAVASRTPSRREAASMAGRLASEDWVEIATAWTGSIARAKAPGFFPPSVIAMAKLASSTTSPAALTTTM